MKKILVIVIVVIILYLVYSNIPTDEQTLQISVSEARSRRFGLIIDTRSQNEREKLGFYPKSIPMDKIHLSDISKSTWILVYSGESAAKVSERLYKMGYKKVRYINESYLSLMPGSFKYI